LANAATGGAQVDRPVHELASQRPDAQLRVIVQASSLSAAEDALQRASGIVHQRLPEISGLAAELRATQIADLARYPGIKRIGLDPLMRAVGHMTWTDTPLSSTFPETVGATQLWSRGLTGSGTAIAVLDSGIHRHPDFGTPSRIVHEERFSVGASNTADQYGHGTWVAGLAAGDGGLSGGRFTGIAPGAAIVNLKVSDDTGRTYTSDVIHALGWAVANRSKLGIRVVNLSLVSSVAEGYATNLLDAAVEMAWHAGIVVVVSAGNQGAGTLRYAPANDPYVVTVGARDEAGTTSTFDGVLAWFSSYGPTPDGFAKPDLVAPGRHLIGPLANSGARLAKEFPTRVIDNRYIQLSGTSAAAPVVSGTVALMLQARPDLGPDQVKWLLSRTARPVGGPPAGIGAGELNAAAATTYAGQPGRANIGLIPNRLVQLAYQSAQASGQVSWDSINWDAVSWDSVSWDSVSWDSVSWDSVSWDSVSWDSVSWDSVLSD
jgi:serine protease AprX